MSILVHIPDELVMCLGIIYKGDNFLSILEISARSLRTQNRDHHDHKNSGMGAVDRDSGWKAPNS